MKYIVYDNITGKIESYGFTTIILQEDAGSGKSIIEADVESDATHYYNIATQIVISRPINTTVLAAGDNTIIGDGIDIANFTIIPVNSSYSIIGPVNSTGTITGTTLDFSTDTAGTYKITIISFPELDVEFEVIAT